MFYTSVNDDNKQVQKHFCSVLTSSKNYLFRAYCNPMYACRLWIRCKQNGVKPLCTVYNNAYHTSQYIFRNKSISHH